MNDRKLLKAYLTGVDDGKKELQSKIDKYEEMGEIEMETTNIMNDELLTVYSEEKQLLNTLKHEYDLLKLGIDQNKLVLKYSPEYASIKTIKEKEERASMAVNADLKKLLELKNQIRDKELTVEILKLQIDFEYFN